MGKHDGAPEEVKCQKSNQNKSKSGRFVQYDEVYKTSTNKLHGTVVGKEFLHTDAPVMPGLQGSRAALRCTQVTGPRVHVFQPVEGPLAHQDIQTVHTVGARERKRTKFSYTKWDSKV